VHNKYSSCNKERRKRGDYLNKSDLCLHCDSIERKIAAEVKFSLQTRGTPSSVRESRMLILEPLKQFKSLGLHAQHIAQVIICQLMLGATCQDFLS
jgi:hypothetical protein